MSPKFWALFIAFISLLLSDYGDYCGILIGCIFYGILIGCIFYVNNVTVTNYFITFLQIVDVTLIYIYIYIYFREFQHMVSIPDDKELSSDQDTN